MYKWRDLEFSVTGVSYYQQKKLLSTVRKEGLLDNRRKGAELNHTERLLDETKNFYYRRIDLYKKNIVCYL